MTLPEPARLRLAGLNAQAATAKRISDEAMATAVEMLGLDPKAQININLDTGLVTVAEKKEDAHVAT